MSYPITTNQYGFVWGPILVERTASNEKSPKWLVLRVWDWKGRIIEIQMTPRKTRIQRERKKK